MKRLLISIVLAVMGYVGTGEPEASAGSCSLGSLRGLWRLTLTETSGNCGAVPPATIIPNTSADSLMGCTTTAKMSADRCEMEESFSCPTDDGRQSWATITYQKASNRAEGVASRIETDSDAGVICRSTYRFTMVKVER